MLAQPARREFQFQAAGLGAELDVGQRRGTAAAVQQHGQTQQHDQVQGAAVPRRHQFFEALQRQLAAVAADQPRQQPLLLAGEPRHVRVLGEVGAVAVVAVVGHVQSHLVQPRGPFEAQIGQRIGELPGVAGRVQELQRGGLHALGLRDVDVVAALHGAHRAFAGILIGESPDHVVEQPLAHGAIGDAQLRDLQHAQDLHQDRKPAGEHRAAVLGEAGELQLPHVAGLPDLAQDPLQHRAGDALGARIELAHHIADGAHGAGAAIGGLPAAAPVGGLDGFEFEARGNPGAGQALHRELAVGEEPFAQGHAAHLQALQLQRLGPLADDQLGAAAADVAHQAPAGLGGHGVGHPRIDQAGLLHAGDDFDGMP